MFGREKEQKRLEGERISILQLQKNLNADSPLQDGEQFTLPAPWKNKAWPQAGGYPNHSMQNLLLSKEPLKKIWSVNIGKGSTDKLPLNAQPVVANDMIFAMDSRNNLSAFDAYTGKKIWSISIASKKEKDPVISGGIAYAHKMLFVTNGYDEVLAISPDDGDIIWRKTLPSPSRAAPTILSGVVYVSTIDSRLIALKANDGTSIWEYRGISETSGLLGAASPSANKNIVVPVFSSGEVIALRRENGAVAWSDNLSNVRRFGSGLESISDITAMPIIDKGLIIVMSFSKKLVAIDERTGTRIWQRDIGGSRTPWIAGNNLFILSSENQLIAINFLNGSIFWITELKRFEDEKNKEDPIQWSAPIMGSNRLILTSSNGYMIEVSPHNGEIIRKTKIRKNVQIAPIIANEHLYLLAEDGTLLAYR